VAACAEAGAGAASAPSELQILAVGSTKKPRPSSERLGALAE